MRYRSLGDRTRFAATALCALLLPGCCDVSQILPEALPDAVVGRAYSVKLKHDCEGKLTEEQIGWEVSGDLPPGIRLSDSTLEGSPRTAGTYSFMVHLRNQSAFTFDTFFSQNFTLTVRPAP
jgi:hypothetical protein